MKDTHSAHKHIPHNSSQQKKSSKKKRTNSRWIQPTIIVALILFSIIISTTLRMAPDELSITQDWAEQVYSAQVKEQIAKQVQAEYPHLPDSQKAVYVNEQFDEAWQQQRPLIQEQIDETANYFKSRLQNDDNQTYLLAIDPYHWFNYAKNFEEYNQMGDSVNEEGKSIFSLRNGREGEPTVFNFHPVLITVVKDIGQVFDKDFSLLRAAYLIPVFIIALAIIPAFFLGRKIGGNVGGFLAGLILAINGALLGRTPAGFSDTDAYIIFFPLLIMWIGIEAMTTRDVRWKIGLGALAGAVFTVFMRTWNSAWHIGSIFAGVLGIYFIVSLIQERKEFSKKNVKTFFTSTRSGKTVLIGLSFILATMMFGSFIMGLGTPDGLSLSNAIEPVKSIITSPFGATSIKSVGEATVFPNVLTTVAELNAGSWEQIITSVGGKLLFLFGLLGIIATFFLKTEDEHMETRYAIMLTFWSVVLITAGLMSSRFIALLAAPFALAFGALFGVTYKKVKDKIKIPQIKNTQLKHIALGLGIGIIAILFLLAPFTSAKQIAKNEVPSMNDAWQESLHTIDNATDDGVITSWWDFGHWFVSEANTRVTFDGGHQGKRIYWVGNYLTNSNSSDADNTLRMLNCGQEEGFNRLVELTNDEYSAVMILEIIQDQPLEEAKTTLSQEGFSDEEIARVVEKTHCSTTEVLDQFVIVSEDMIGKAPVWGHFGNWDFDKAKAYNIVRKSKTIDDAISTLQSTFNYDEKKATQMYYDITALRKADVDSWMSPWPSYVTTQPVTCEENTKNYTCTINKIVEEQGSNQLVISQAVVSKVSPQDSYMVLSTVSKGQVVNKQQTVFKEITINGQTTTSKKDGYAIVIEDGKAIVADPLVANSQFTKLFFFEGARTTGYEKISDVRDFTGARIIVYKKTFEE
ncbi:MAG: STT3 domain-containing protein [Candidatus Woesearchaeota archaeon]